MHFLRPNYRQMPLSAFLVRLRLLRLLLCLCLVVFNVHQNTATTLISIISRLLNIGYYPILIDCPCHSTPCALESRVSSSLLNLASARQSGTQPDVPLVVNLQRNGLCLTYWEL